MKGRIERWAASLFTPVDAASLGVFRIVLGTMVAWDVARYAYEGWIDEYYLAPAVHFTYLYLDFVRPWPGPWLYVHFAATGVLALLVALGLFSRLAAPLLFLAYTYVFLLEQSVYMNHYYLIALLAFLLCWMPAERAFSLDRRRRPDLPDTVPRWTVLVLRFQLVVVYAYGAIAKLNPDWLAGEPMYTELVHHGPDVPAIATRLPPALVAYAIAYGGIAVDAGLPLLLCIRRTRGIGFVVATVFHLLNEIFLRIGVFSYLMTGAITIFFDPDWPRRLWARPRAARALHVPPPGAPPGQARRWLTLGALGCYALVQLLFPLRHWLYPGDVSWTEEGHRFSWHMKLRLKNSQLTITVTDPDTGRSWQLDPSRDLRPRQLRKLYTFPDILLQYVHHHRDRLRAEGLRDPIITVDWQCSLNGRPARPLIDPTANLAAVERSIWPAPWILRHE